MDIIFREIREFGESLILLDQHPSKISLYALGNSYTTIAMNLKHKTDINAMSQCLLLDKEKDILGALDVGQAVVKLQGRIARPFQVSIPLFKIQKGSVCDTDVKRHMKDIAPAAQDEDFRLPNQITDTKIASNPGLKDLGILSFISDIKDYPDSGIAERYKRLGISVRQGQKVKTIMLKEELIQESVNTTSIGRIKMIVLTKKGMELLSDLS